MKKALTLALLGLLSIGILNAQNDPKSSKILDRVSKKYKAYKTGTVGFTIKTENTVSKKTTTNSGKLWMKGEKFKYDYQDEVVYCDGKTLWTYNKEIEEVTIEKFKKTDNNISPSNIFTIYNKGFFSRYDGLKTVGGKQHEKVLLTPKDKKKNKFFQIEMLIDKSTSRIKSMKVFYKNGFRITYSINSFKANAEMSNSYFVFDKTKFPDVVVVDLR